MELTWAEPPVYKEEAETDDNSGEEIQEEARLIVDITGTNITPHVRVGRT